MNCFLNELRIGLWEGPRAFAVQTDEDMEYRFREIRENGIDTMFLFAELADGIWLNRTLRMAEKCGVCLIVDTSAVWRDRERLKAAVDATKNSCAVIAYNIMDEPPISFADDLASVMAWYKETVPDKPVFVNLNPNYAPPSYLPEGNTVHERYTAYLSAFLNKVPVDLLSFDFYPYVGSPEAEAKMKLSMLENLSDVAQASRRYGIPFAGFLQSSRWGRFDDNRDRTSPWHGTRVPRECEFRFLANLHLAFGAKMLTDFLYWSRSGTRPDQRMPGVFDGIMWEDGTRSPFYPIAQRIHREIRTAAEDLQSGTLTGIMTGGLSQEENEAIGALRITEFAGVTSIKTEGRVLAGCFDAPDGAKMLYVVNINDEMDSDTYVSLQGASANRYTVTCISGYESENGRLILPAGASVLVKLK